MKHQNRLMTRKTSLSQLMNDAPRSKRLNEVNKPLVIMFDNASIHDSADISLALAEFEKADVKLEVL